MFKLLTEEEKDKVMHEYRRRRLVVTLTALVLVLVVGLIGLLPSYVLSNARRDEVLERARIVGQSSHTTEESNNLQAWLVKMNRKLKLLSPELDTDRPSNFIQLVLDQRVAGIRITSFSWTKNGDKITLSANGIASDRQTLVKFESLINSSGHFSEVTLPVSNLARDKDIDFQIKFIPASPSSLIPTPPTS